MRSGKFCNGRPPALNDMLLPGGSTIGRYTSLSFYFIVEQIDFADPTFIAAIFADLS